MTVEENHLHPKICLKIFSNGSELKFAVKNIAKKKPSFGNSLRLQLVSMFVAECWRGMGLKMT